MATGYENETEERDVVSGVDETDVAGVEGRDIVKVFRKIDGSLVRDCDGNFVVLVVPAMIPADDGAWEKVFQLFLRETEEVRFRLDRQVLEGFWSKWGKDANNFNVSLLFLF